MTFKVLLAAALAVAVSAPALADDKAKDDGKGAAAPAKEKKICRNETTTGSLVAKRRICMTAAEWDELSQKTRKNIDDFAKDAALPQQGANPLGG